MASARPNQNSSYLRRLGTYLVPVAICAMAGATYARFVGNWPETTALGGLLAIPFSVGPGLLVISAVQLDRKATALVAAVASAVIILMWVLFAHTTSDKAILAFLWGPPVGIPVAAVVTVAMRRRQAAELAPGRPDPGARPTV